MEIRKRKKASHSKGPRGVLSGSQRLVEELENLWKRVSGEGVTRKEYDRYVSNLIASRKPVAQKSKKKRICLRLFDCIWTIVLFIAGVTVLAMISPVFKSLLYTAVHPHLYSITRVMRFAFLAVHPYLLLVGLDFTGLCVVQNPLANSTMHCPCISDPGPIIININQSGLLSRNVIEDETGVYVLRNAVPIEEMYGRETLVKYFNQSGELPEPCFESGSRPEDSPINYQALLNNSYWDEVKKFDPWFHVWMECSERSSMRKLLPEYQVLYENHEVTEESLPHYWLATQWAKSYEFLNNEQHNRNLFLVLQGTIKIKIDITSIPCSYYCYDVYQPLVLSEGDALLYNPKHWFYTSQTWTDTSFAIAVSMTVNK